MSAALRALGVIAVLLGSNLTAAEPPASPAAAAGCAIHWQITPRLDAAPRHLALTMSFDTGPRSRTELRLPIGWAAAEDYAEQFSEVITADAGQRIEPVPGQPARYAIRHAPGERVTLRFKVGSPIADPDRAPMSHADSYRTLLGKGWFRFFGHAVLPLPEGVDDKARVTMCLGFDGLSADSVIATSHGLRRGAAALFRVTGGAQLMRHAEYLGGALQLRERSVDGRPLAVAMPPATPWAFAIDDLADAVAQLVGTQRSFWGDADFPFLLVAAQPNHQASGSYGGTAVQQAFAMHASDDLRLAGPQFLHLVAHELLHAWIPTRFGPMSHEGRDDEALRYWFSEGFTEHYTHRLLVRAGLWTLDDYALALNRKIERYRQSGERRADNARVRAEFFRDTEVGELPYARGEFLALRWHGALRDKGLPGLDAVMRALMLPRDKARAEARLSEPLATQRLFAALRPALGELPLGDVTQFVEAGAEFEFSPGLLGPCFVITREMRGLFELGFDPASLRRRVLGGVAADGPAYAAGLRNGMKLAGFSVQRGDAQQDALLQIVGADGLVRDVRYKPVSTQQHEALAYQPIPRALDETACRGWMGLAPEAAGTTAPRLAPAKGKKVRPKSPKRATTR